MRFKKKKGFTIIELVIVIAVIGILTAILVPTFINLTNKANEAADQSLVKNLNTTLSVAEADIQKGYKKPSNPTDMFEILRGEGYIGETLIRDQRSGKKILYNLNKNRFLFEEDKTSAEYKSFKDEDFWTFGLEVDTTGYSTYLFEEYNSTAALNITSGLDVGANDEVTSITYTSSVAKKVVIRTNGGELVVNDTDPASEQIQYGSLAEADVTTGDNCFMTHGKIANMDLKEGKAVAKDGGYVALTNAAPGTQAVEDGGLFFIPAGTATDGIDSEVAESLGYKDNGGTLIIDNESEAGASRAAKIASTDFIIYTAGELATFRDMVNSGNTFAGVTVKLGADIDLSGVDWIPIGQYKDLDGNKPYTLFSGTFDGQNHIIDNMHIIALSSINTFKSSYRALFGYTDGVIKNFTVKGSIVGTDCAGVVAALAKGGLISNVNSYVTLTGQTGKKGGDIPEYQDYLQGKTAGICLTTKPDDAANSSGVWRIENCNNYGDVSSSAASGDGVGGIIAWTGERTSNWDLVNTGLFVKNCNNYGAITCSGAAPTGGISGHACKISIENCVNEGSISGSTAGGIYGDATDAIINKCENKATISGGRTGGIGSYSYNVHFSQLKNSGTISGTGVKGEIFAELDCTNVDVNEFTFTRTIKSIGVYNPKADNVTRYIDHADDDTIGVIDFTINANKTDTVQIRNSTITTLNVKPNDNHTAKLQLDNSNIGTINLNNGVSNMTHGYSIYIEEKEGTANSLGNVNLYGTLKSNPASNTIHMYFGIACTFNRTSESSSSYVLDMHATEGYTILGPVSNVWTITKDS